MQMQTSQKYSADAQPDSRHRASSFNAAGSQEEEEESPESPINDTWKPLRDQIISKLENIRTKKGMLDATRADPLNLTIEDIISLPLKNSMSAHSTKGVSGL